MPGGTTVWNDLDGSLNGVGGTFANESTNGFIGGGQIGYNWQFHHAVFGLETDFDYLSLNQTTNFLDLSGAGDAADHLHDAIRWLGTVRGRAGLALDNVLLYLTAGLAYGQTDHSITSIVNGLPNRSESHDFNDSRSGPPPASAWNSVSTRAGRSRRKPCTSILVGTPELSLAITLPSATESTVAWRRSTQCGSSAPA
jgi:opacity protein-like surface antigen